MTKGKHVAVKHRKKKSAKPPGKGPATLAAGALAGSVMMLSVATGANAADLAPTQPKTPTTTIGQAESSTAANTGTPDGPTSAVTADTTVVADDLVTPVEPPVIPPTDPVTPVEPPVTPPTDPVTPVEPPVTPPTDPVVVPGGPVDPAPAPAPVPAAPIVSAGVTLPVASAAGYNGPAAPVTGVTGSAAPVQTQVPAVAVQAVGGQLARTGASQDQTVLGGVGAGLLLAGGGAVVLSRRQLKARDSL